MTDATLDNGPILSGVMDLMTGESYQQGFWAQHISSPSNYMIELIDEAGNDQLSKAEEQLVDEIIVKYGGLDRRQLGDKSHELPEWQNPHGSGQQRFANCPSAAGCRAPRMGTQASL